jgi:hypothetical protein
LGGIDASLRTHASQAGISWHLLAYLFDFDFTLEEADVEINEKTHIQAISNRNASAALRALSRMAGYTSASIMMWFLCSYLRVQRAGQTRRLRISHFRTR